ncbi:MAG: NAD(P)H-hydrate dehydratase [Gammaproteobacteria bacterium]|nr:NAD(P)H-hydrate dehydratase [Gammaproteobacteria bacterium]MCK5092147.1 NAD(P)H-hydrate dehydratase [Gammaproteobacteria bacterium]
MDTLPLSLPLSLYGAAQVRELDRIAIEDHGIAGYTLMTQAASAAFDVMNRHWPDVKQVAVLCGTGNNGGDGYILARLARETGLEVKVIQLGDHGSLKCDALQAYQDWEKAGGKSSIFSSDVFQDTDLIVDALLGTGLEREVTGEWAQVIGAVNASSLPVFSLDIPSGLHSDTGVVMGVAVHAELTISFIGLKQGLFTGKAADYCGKILFNDLQVPHEVYADIEPSAVRIEHEIIFRLLPKRSRTSHKGRCGHVLVIGGDHGMAGAVRMAGEAAARVGAGLVSIATRSAHAAVIASSRPELMCHGVENSESLRPLLKRATVIAIGPGLGQSAWAHALLEAAMDSGLPMIVDADALNLLAKDPCTKDNWILTPHPGEAARLLDETVAEVQSDRFAAIEKLANKFNGVCVLKGSGTLIKQQGEVTRVCDLGNPGMASGGMGDVLTGVIAGLVAQGLTLEDAAQAGVYIHASAADMAVTKGERGLIASDLMVQLRGLVNPNL